MQYPNAILFLLFFSLSIQATIYQIPDVIVSDNRAVGSQVSTPARIQVLTEQDILRSGAQNLVELINGAMGIQIIQQSGDESSSLMSMRGFAENAHANVLILIDGRKLNGIDLATPDFTTIDLQTVERVEMIQGSHGTLFGDQAVAGVINIISKTPHNNSVTSRVTLGEYDLQKYSIQLDDIEDSGFHYRIWAQKHLADHYRDRSNTDHNNLLTRFGFTSGHNHYFLEAQLSEREQLLPGAINNQQVENDRKQSIFPDDFMNNKTYLLSLVIRHALTSSLQFESEITAKDSDIDAKISGFEFEQFRNTYSFTPRVIASFDWLGLEHMLTTGIDYQYTDYRLVSSFLPTLANQHNAAIYSQLVTTLSPRFTVTTGGRYARYEAEVNQVNFDDDIWVGELGLTYQASEQFKLFARMDGNFRYPKVDEQSFTVSRVGELDIQSGISYETGLSFSHTDYFFETLFYWLRLNNEVIFDPTLARLGAAFPGANTNLKSTDRQGFNLYFKYQISPTIALSSNYHYVDTEVTGGPFKGHRIPFVSEHALKNTLDYHYNDNWHGYLESNTISDRPAGSDSANRLRKLGGTTVLNAAVSYLYQGLKLQLKLNNLTNKHYHHYVVAQGDNLLFYPAPTRNVLLEASYALDFTK